MYTSIKIATIKKALRFFARTLTTATKKTINLCLELIRFGMSSTLICFDGEYYKYHDGEKEDQGLAIGGYESAFLVDLVASYLFEKAKAHFHPTIYHCIYRDDGLVVFKGKKSVKVIKYWLDEFQKTVDKAAGNQHLQFTAEIWKPDENPPPQAKKERVQIATKDKFPFLDMEMRWTPEGELNFSVFRKAGQQLKYVGKEINHTPGTLRAIPWGVLNRLAKLTSQKTSLHSEGVDKVYPDHANALCKAGFAPPDFPTMEDLCKMQD